MLKHDRLAANQLCVRGYPTCTQHDPKCGGVLQLFYRLYPAEQSLEYTHGAGKSFQAPRLQLLATPPSPITLR